ncbi:peptidyl-prolyl cis-trans isomerase sig-7-like, partial [Teleopsis dalmanni]|uniref:peptidyl-prolyl cis-trans isomerase sig-7-like n=1 Tax=Teleopsis dalmanni TaxID=139649 RepID=UPI0018CD6BC3
MSVVIETTIGDITVDLFTEQRPIACLNFIKLCKLKYYNYNLFHTVEQNFIAQTGDPSGAGNGGSSIWGVIEGPQKRFFQAENLPKINHTSPGLLSLVSPGKNLVGSQFFFTLDSNLTFLDGVHCVIGEVVEGFDILRTLNETIVDDNSRPFQDIRITHTVILNDPFDDPRGFQVPSRSPSPNEERLKNGRIAADEDIYDTEGKSVEELQEMIADREAKARATILEIVGDIPDADVAPPENVLFVCKLNPVTTDDDLEIIFSRFGRVKTCEVIRDKKTGDSLQYAFVEFEEQKSCEAAYFKMDNVLIDDRRIHVDFSQSVAKVKWRGKGRGVDGMQGKFDFNDLSEEKNKKGESRNTYKNRRRSPEYRQYDRKNRSPRRSRSRERRDFSARKRKDDSSERYTKSNKYNRKSPAHNDDAKYHRARHQSQSPSRKHRSNSKNRNINRDERSRCSRSPARVQNEYSRERENYRKRRMEDNSSPDRTYKNRHSPLRGRRADHNDYERNRHHRNTHSPPRNYRDERKHDRQRSNSNSPSRRDRLDPKVCERKNGKSNDNIEHRRRTELTQHEQSERHSRYDSVSNNHKPLYDSRTRKDHSVDKSIKPSHDEKKKRKMSEQKDRKRKNKKTKDSSSSETESNSSTSDSSTTSSSSSTSDNSTPSSSSSSSQDERKRKKNKEKKSRKTSKKYK